MEISISNIRSFIYSGSNSNKTLNITKEEEMMNNLYTNKKGITIVALIITVILMLILASVSVTVSINSGLFENTKNAKLRTEITEIQERLMKKIMINEGQVLNGTINEVLGIDSQYNDKLKIENSKIVYLKDKWSEKQISELQEMGISESN